MCAVLTLALTHHALDTTDPVSVQYRFTCTALIKKKHVES